MGKNSEIEWTNHTFNPWWGCAKVSPACQYCYAEAWAKRVGSNVWGKKVKRRFFSESHWAEPIKWNSEAEMLNVRCRVFCASMADVFESKEGLDKERTKLWALIEKTSSLDWLLLTKRPENIGKMIPWKGNWPPNVWIGTTVENQEWLDKRMGHLLSQNAAVRFVSCEPLLGELDFSKWIGRRGLYPLNWVIAGGESGPKSRPMHPDWVRKLRDYCHSHKIAFHFKQWGHWIPAYMLQNSHERKTIQVFENSDVEMVPVGKREAGRSLDGVTYDELPIALA